MKSHFDGKTVPKDARRFPPNAYIWEQDGHIAHVRKDARGNYHHEFTKLHPSDEAINKTIRHFMLEKGMAPREGWKAFSEHWDDIHRQIGTAFIGAISGGRMPGRVPGGVTVKPAVRPPAAVRRPGVAPSPSGAGAGVATKPDYGKTLTADPGRARTQTAGGSAVNTGAPTQPGGKTVNTSGPTVTSGNPAVNTGARTVDANGASARPGRSGANGYGTVAPGVRVHKQLPDSQRITVRTPGGPRDMTVGEYRQRHARAEKWLSGQLQEYQRQTGYTRRGTYPPNYDALSKQAQEKFGLDAGWRSVGNPYIHGRL